MNSSTFKVAKFETVEKAGFLGGDVTDATSDWWDIFCEFYFVAERRGESDTG